MLSSLLQRFRKRPPGAFERAVSTFLPRLGEWQKIPKAPGNGRKVAVLVTPWLDTSVPFYSIETACALRSAGCEIVFLFDTTQLTFNKVSTTTLAAFELLKPQLTALGEVVEMATVTASEGAWTGNAKNLAYENAVWLTKGEALANEFLEKNPEAAKEIEQHGGRVAATLSSIKVDWLLMPGGAFGLSGIYLAAAQGAGLDYTTFDSGPGRFFPAHKGIAAHSADLPDAFARLSKSCTESPELKSFVLNAAKELFREREEMRDHFQFQNAPRAGTTGKSYDLLVCLNYRADTAALLRNRCFSTVESWVTSVVDWAVERGLHVAIRPHPVQRRSHVRTTDRLDEIIRARDPEGRVVDWIPADAEINSYDLIENSRVVLPFTSTVGIEAAYLGRPVILAALNYYQDLGFAIPCETKDEYFTAIEKALAGKSDPNQKQHEAAAICLYLAVRCRSVHAKFTPQPADFAEWVATPVAELWAQPELQDLTRALVERVPLTWLRHERRAAAIQSDAA